MKPSNRTLITLLVIGLSACAVAQQADPEKNFGSLFPTSGSTNYYSRRTAHQVGDILTIVINESNAASLGATTTSTKTDSNVVNATTSPLLNWLKIPGITALLGGGSTGATSSTSGTGQTTNNQSWTAMIAVVIKSVDTNGNFIIEGTKWLKVNKESQNLLITGMVRPDDVQTDNQVLSQNVANAKITTDGKGLIADRQRRGLLTRILEWMF
jgi:flagellar L-ring protein precursor FlgH